MAQAGKSRTEYSARNMAYATVSRTLALLMGFVSRVVFTHTLSQDYVGVNGLFFDIVNVLSLTELGLGTAISYALYAPIAQGDIEKQKSLMDLYRKFYYMVAGIVTVLGLLVIPFMGVLIKNPPNVEHLTFIYLMYLTNSVISYFWIYKKTLLDAHQLSYIGTLYQTSSWIVQIIIQIVILVTTHNFVLYLSIMLGSTLVSNLLISRKADKLYPYLKDKQVAPLSKEDRDDIFTNVKAMILHKIGDVAINNTDNLILSSVVGIVAAGLYSNYYLIIASVTGVFTQVFQGVAASVGNLGVVEDKNRVKRIFESTFLLGHWMYGVAAICMYEVLDMFVDISFGSNYVFSGNVTLLLCLNFYLIGVCQASFLFRDSLGLFYYDRFKSLAAAFINLVVSIALGIVIGVEGVFIGTLVSTIATSLWIEPVVIYKKRLHSGLGRYFMRLVLYIASTAMLGGVCHFLCSYIVMGKVATILLRLVICLVVVDFGYLLFFGWTQEFHLLFEKGILTLKKWLRRSVGTDKKRTDNQLSEEQLRLCELLNSSIREKVDIGLTLDEIKSTEELAVQQGVLGLLYPYIDKMPAVMARKTTDSAISCAKRFYRALYVGRYLVEELEKEQIKTVIIKGPDLSARYPVPEYRSFGDIDLLLWDKSQSESACKILEKLGCIKKEEQVSTHHTAFVFQGDFYVELHSFVVRPFAMERVNRRIGEIYCINERQVIYKDILGYKLPVLRDSLNGFYLLLHMLQHFLNGGFGVRLLCDWCVFWNSVEDDQEICRYNELVKELGVKEFSDKVTQVCVAYFGMAEEKATAIAGQSGIYIEKNDNTFLEEFLFDIFESGRFGESDPNRIVALQKVSLAGLTQEFHHQTKANFPKASRFFALWPGLWIATLVRFLKNNKNIRNTAGKSVVTVAMKRGQIVEKMHLWH